MRRCHCTLDRRYMPSNERISEKTYARQLVECLELRSYVFSDRIWHRSLFPFGNLFIIGKCLLLRRPVHALYVWVCVCARDTFNRITKILFWLSLFVKGFAFTCSAKAIDFSTIFLSCRFSAFLSFPFLRHVSFVFYIFGGDVSCVRKFRGKLFVYAVACCVACVCVCCGLAVAIRCDASNFSVSHRTQHNERTFERGIRSSVWMIFAHKQPHTIIAIGTAMIFIRYWFLFFSPKWKWIFASQPTERVTGRKGTKCEMCVAEVFDLKWRCVNYVVAENVSSIFFRFRSFVPPNTVCQGFRSIAFESKWHLSRHNFNTHVECVVL